MSQSTDPVRIWGVVPAAGSGRRMGGPKQALPLGDSTLAATVISTLLLAGVAGVVVVTRRDLRRRLRLPSDPRICIVFNDDARSDMLASVRIGVASLSSADAAARDGVLVVPADMPTLTAASVAACLAAYRTDPVRIVIAAHRGVRGHPVIFPLALQSELADLSDGLRELARRRAERVCIVECRDAGVVRDVDTPSDYRALRVPRAAD